MKDQEKITLNSLDKKGSGTTGRQRLGELLIEYGVIDKGQLEMALKRQSQSGGHIGSILIEMGFITVDNFLNFLSKRFGVPGVNLFKMTIQKEALQILPKEKIESSDILPIDMDDKSITLAMVNPQDFALITELEFSLGKKIRPVVVPSFMLHAAKETFLSTPNRELRGTELERMVDEKRGGTEESPELMKMLKYLIKSGASDMLLTAGTSASIKINNELKRISMASLSPMDCEKYARQLISKEEWDLFLSKNDYGFGVTYPDIGRFRINIYRQRNSVSIAIRPIADKIPSFSQLNLPEWLRNYSLLPRGIILVSGPAGHGKSTTLNAMVDVINTERKCNIVTLEDPIEYLHKHKKSNINQREVGRDTETFYEGLKNVLRQAPDVIVVGEMRDKESFEIALHAAETGHLVLSTVHADNTTALIERIINMFEPHRQNLIRIMLCGTLIISLSQRLIPLKSGKGRILALERLVNSYRIRNLIREEKTHQIRSQYQAGTEDFTSIDVAIAELCKKGLITYEAGLQYVEDEVFYQELSSGVRSKK